VVTVVDDRLIAMKAVDVPEGGTSVDLAVTDDWGPGAYVTATLFRPMDVPAKRMPSRALGLTWASRPATAISRSPSTSSPRCGRASR
jgi:hypothetical protein